jgi:mycothiol synthase
VLEIRRCAETDEKARWLAIYNEVVPEHAVALEDIERWESAHIASVEFLGLLDDEPAGSASAAIGDARPGAARTFLTVLPARRRRGLGSALYRAVSAWAAEHGASELLARIREDEPESLAFAERRGYRVIARDSNLFLDLTNLEPLPVDPPAGIEIVRWADRPELARGLHNATFETNPDVPGSEDWRGEPFEAWERMHRPELMFVALAGDDVVGFAELFTTEARPGVAVHALTGVRRAWRGRGIAGALKRAQIAWAKGAGYERLQTANEVRNEPIRRLNERLGYREEPGRLEVRGPLAATDAP